MVAGSVMLSSVPMISRGILLVLACVLQVGTGWSVRPAAATSAVEINERYGPAVVQIRILNRAASSKSAIGAGFYVGPLGRIVTNYHVVADLVQRPRKYQAELVGKDGTVLPLELLNIDVVHDLAILQAPAAPPLALELAEEPPRQGSRLFSLGNPLDLGTSIVEGTYNGLLQETLYEKIHFTASINPGMSGGPVIDDRGRVVGINVSTAGNSLSFLVPVKFADELYRATAAIDFEKPAKFVDLVRAELIRNQQTLMDRLLGSRFEEVTLGPYQLPGRFASFVKCWGDERSDKRQPYSVVVHNCSTSDSVYVGGGLTSGAIEYEHRLLTARHLNRFQFYALYEDRFSGGRISGAGSPDAVTRFECESDFVQHGGIESKMVLCLRAYRKYRGLYDAVLMSASLDANDSGLQSKLEMHGVSFENAHLLARKFVDAIRWAPRS